MSGSDDWERKKNIAPGNDSVGYGRPPVAKQFKPGQSGNPRGRRKGVKNVATILNEALYRSVRIRIDGRVRTLPRIQAIVEVTLYKAMQGDGPAFSKLLELAQKLGGFEFLANSAPRSPNRESARERLEKLFAQNDPDLLDGAGSSAGAPKPNSDQKKTEG